MCGDKETSSASLILLAQLNVNWNEEEKVKNSLLSWGFSIKHTVLPRDHGFMDSLQEREGKAFL